MFEVFNLIAPMVAIIIAFDIFEFTKALASTLMGDTTPREKGQLALNPLKHFEPIGFLLMYFYGIGWGQPVETSYKSKRNGTLVTYLSPVIVSILLAFGLLNLSDYPEVLLGDSYFGVFLSMFLVYLGRYFVILAVINLIPVHPFCGSKLIRCFLNPNAQVKYSQSEKMLQMIFIFLLLFGVISPVVGYASNWVVDILTLGN